MNKCLYFILLPLLTFALTSCGTDESTPSRYPIYNNQQVTIDSSALEVLHDIKISDGDTIKASLDNQKKTIRLIGIDTFETSKSNKAYKQAYEYNLSIDEVVVKGKQAKEFMSYLLKGKSQLFLELDADKTDRYDRILAYIWSGDTQMINMQIVCSGYALVLTIKPNDKYAQKFDTCYKYARQNNLGMWKN